MRDAVAEIALQGRAAQSELLRALANGGPGYGQGPPQAVLLGGAAGLAEGGEGAPTPVMRYGYDPLRKLQEQDPDFDRYDGRTESLLRWLVDIQRKSRTRRLDDMIERHGRIL